MIMMETPLIALIFAAPLVVVCLGCGSSPATTVPPVKQLAGDGVRLESFPGASKLLMEYHEGNVRSLELTTTEPGGKIAVYRSNDPGRVSLYLSKVLFGYNKVRAAKTATVRVTFKQLTTTEAPSSFRTYAAVALKPQHGFVRVK